MKALRYFTAAAALVALAACNKEDMDLGGFNSDPNAVRITAGVGTPFTRSNPVGTNEADRTKFNAGDRISVKTEGQDAITYTLTTGVWTPEGGKYLKWNAASETFSAYYPAGTYDGTQTTVPADQHEEGHIAQADYMKCERVVRDKSEGTVSLTLSRQTARIAISQLRWAEQYGTDMQHIFSLVLCDGVSGDIKPYKAGSGTYYALLMPGNGAADETFIKITVWDGNTEDSKQDLIVRGIPALEAGKSYECTLTLGKEFLGINSVTVMDWPSGGVISDDENLTEEVITYEYVDLDLTTGTLWATCNVGATSPEEYGDYFAWGETASKSDYSWDTYKYGGFYSLTKYCNSSDYGKDGFTDNLITLEASDDAATANWGSDWRMPTKKEMEELAVECTWTWTTDYNSTGTAGYIVSSKAAGNTNSIFLPAASFRNATEEPSGNGSYGYYWCSSLDAENNDPTRAWNFTIYSGSNNDIETNSRYYGLSVRAVYTPAN